MEVAAAGIALFQLLDRVIQISKHIIDTVKDAPNDIQLIHSEILSLRFILEQLRDSRTLEIPVLTGINGSVQRCKIAVEKLEVLLGCDAILLSSGKKRKTFEITFATLAWALKESKARKLLAEISQQKGTILLALSGSMVQDIRAIKDDVGKIREEMKDNLTNQTRDAILDWLQLTNPSAKHNASFQNHEPETSQWIHKTPEWQAWLGDNPLVNSLWLHGIPGCGKTVLASYLIEQVKKFCSSHEDQEYAFYYCNQNTQEETLPFLRWVVSRLCRRSSFVPKLLIEAHSERCEPPITDLLKFLEIILRRFQRVFIILDAVDESKERGKLLHVLKKLSEFQNVRLLATSRNYYDIETTLAGVSMSVSMSNPLVDQDIRLAVRSNLGRNKKLQKWKKFFPEMENAIANGAQGMFRWAVCQLHILERLQPTTDLHEELQNLPPDLDAAYEKIFQQISERHRRVVRKILLWILGHDDIIRGFGFTHEPIPLRVLVAGTSADLYEPQCLAKNAYDVELLRDLCGCLIDVQPRIVGEVDLEDPKDREGSKVAAETEIVEVISCAHYTVKEYLYSERVRSSSAAYFALDDKEVHLEFSTSIFSQALNFTSPPKAYRWLDSAEAYAVASCGKLAEYDPDGPDRSEEAAMNLILGNTKLFSLVCHFFDPSRPHYKSLACVRNVKFGNPYSHFSLMAEDIPQWELPLSSVDASILTNLLLRNLNPIAEKFMKDKDIKELCAIQQKVHIWTVSAPDEWDWKLRSCIGTIPVILAFSLPSQGCIRRFLEYAGNDIDATCMLVNLVCSGFIDTGVGVDLLLELGADPDAPGYALTPLQLAAWGRNTTSIEMLLQHGADHQAKGVKGGKAVAFFKEDVQGLCPLDILRSNNYLWDLVHGEEDSDGWRQSVCVDLIMRWELGDSPDDEESINEG